MLISTVMGIMVWLVDGIYDYRVYGGSDRWMILFDPPFHELFTRPFMFLFFILFGVVVAEMMVKQARADQALEEANEELESRVSERTTELTEANTRLRSLSSRLLTAQEKERRRISRELHDELGQSLTALKFRLRFIEKNLSVAQGKLVDECEEAVKRIDELTESIHRLSWDLSPCIIQNMGVSKAIKWLVDDFATTYNFDARLESADIDTLFSEPAQINIYRILQEALTNVAKHAEAINIAVSIVQQNGSVSFSIEDNGKGFNTDRFTHGSSVGKNLGLATISERINMLGGRLAVSSREGKGTRLSFSVPV